MSNRNKPMSIDFFGLRLYYRIAISEGEVERIIVSRRKEKDGQMGEILCQRYCWVPKSIVVLEGGAFSQEDLSHLIENLLFKNHFLDEILKHEPDLLSRAGNWPIAGFYALDKYQQRRDKKLDKKKKKQQWNAMRKMAELWCDKSVADIKPVKEIIDDLDKESQTTAEVCKSLLKELFSGELVNIAPEASSAWRKYSPLKRRKKYNAKRQDHQIRNHLVLSNLECMNITQKCLENWEQNRLYIAVLLMMLLGMKPQEVLALKLENIKELEGYDGYMEIIVEDELVWSERRNKSRKKATRCSTIKKIPDKHQKRIVPVGKLLSKLLKTIKDAQSTDQAYLIFNPKYKIRHYRLDQLEEWMSDTFGDMIARPDATIPISKFLYATAYENLWRHGLREEERNAQLGYADSDIEVIYYIDFCAPALLRAMADVQNVWMDSYGLGFDRKSTPYMKVIQGEKGCCSAVDFCISIPAHSETLKLIICGKHGLNGCFELQDKKQEERAV